MSAKLDALVGKISLQRAELAAAYRELEKPLHYVEVGMRGFGFLKRYPWITVAAPSVVSMLLSVLGFVRRQGQPTKRKLDEEQRRELHQLVEQVAERRRQPVARWLGYGLQAFRAYRQVRRLLPFLP